MSGEHENHRYPLLFGFGEVVVGRGYVAGVVISQGRIIAEKQPDGWWLDGVNPGAIADGGGTLHEAVAHFRSRFRAVLADLAESSATFGEFADQVQDFFAATDPESVAAWEEARRAVQANGEPGLEMAVQRFEPAKMTVTVREIRQPSQNLTEERSPALAA